MKKNPEQRRLDAQRTGKADWLLWGPYLAERAWGTVREDYSLTGEAWEYFSHDHAPRRAYRWNEDGLAGFCDRDQHLCMSLALWNGRDRILKERLYGLAGPEGNHGEDVKEHYWYLDSSPTHSFARMRYRYPQQAFPYDELREQNQSRNRHDPEYELTDTGIFDDGRFFDVTVTYAKASASDVLISIEIHNRAARSAQLTVLPQLWFRNTWTWDADTPPGPDPDTRAHPSLSLAGSRCIDVEHPMLGRYHLYWQGKAEALFTHNVTHRERLYDSPSASPYTKDAFHRLVVEGEADAVNPAKRGTKAGVHYTLRLAAGARRTVQLRLSRDPRERPFSGFTAILKRRQAETDQYYATLQAPTLDDADRRVQRQAFAGMLWSKQFYHYDVSRWLHGDPHLPVERTHPRNRHWSHLTASDILSMPDTWEYPWFAVWDTAFHCIPLAMVDVDFAKEQLLLMSRERFMHPNGQLPAYEWAFDDVNPPVHAWSVLTVFRMERQQRGSGDTTFLATLFHKLLMNFTWWVNQKDKSGNDIFEGGFLGLDNISLFDRSETPPMGGQLGQSDATAWMGFYALCMMQIALELAVRDSSYQSIASKFFEHYLRIATAINGTRWHPGLWDEKHGFYFDHLHLPHGEIRAIEVHSLVGLMPLIAVSTLSEQTLSDNPDFADSMQRLLARQPRLASPMADVKQAGSGHRHLLSFLSIDKLRRVLDRLLDENEFLSPYGIRSLSKVHEDAPYTYTTDTGELLSVHYEPAESSSAMFGGNSNWRGPVWFPINYLIIEGLRQYGACLGDSFRVECPARSGRHLTLGEVADELSLRLIRLFRADGDGRYPWSRKDASLQSAASEGMVQFFEYFNGDDGSGLGASHQTGWTGLIAILLQQQASRPG